MPGGDLSIPLWGPGARDPIEVCRPLGVEVWQPESGLLAGLALARARRLPRRPWDGPADGRRRGDPMSAEEAGPTLAEIRAARERLGDLVVETPMWRWRGREISEHLEGRHRGRPEARALPAHGHVQAARRPDGDAGARPGHPRARGHRGERRQPRDRGRVRRARARHDRQGRDAAHGEPGARRRVPVVGRRGRAGRRRAPGLRARARDRGRRGPDVRPPVRGAAHRPRHRDGRARAGEPGARPRRGDRADRRAAGSAPASRPR